MRPPPPLVAPCIFFSHIATIPSILCGRMMDDTSQVVVACKFRFTLKSVT